MAKNLTDASPRLDDAQLDQLAAANQSQFSRGLRSGGLGMMGQLNTLAGEVGQRLGATGFAADRLAAANDYAQQAQEAAPRVTRFRDATTSLRDAGDYLAGLAGGAVPAVLPAVAAGMLTRNPMAGAALAGGALAPFEVGDVLQRQRAEGQPTDLRSAALAGGASALAQGLVPGMMRGRLAGAVPVRGGIAREAVTEATENALANVAGEGIKQVGAGQAADPEALLEAGASGAVIGAPLGAVAGLAGKGHKASGRPGEAQTLPGAAGAPGGPSDAPQAPSGGAPGVSEATYAGLKGVAERAKTAGRDVAERVKQGLPSSIDGLADLDPQALMQRMKVLDGDTVAEAKAWGEGLLNDAGLTPERREKVAKALGDLGNEASRSYIAAEKLARQKARDVTGAIDRLHARVTEREGDGNTDGSFSTSAKQVREIVEPYLRAAPGKVRGLADAAAERVTQSQLPDDVKAQVQAALKNPGEAANRAYVAAADYMASSYRGTDWSGIGDNVKGLAKALARTGVDQGIKGVDAVQGWLDDLRAKRGLTDQTKKSEDYSGVDAKIGEALLPILRKAAPEVLDSPESINKAASTLRMFMQQVAQREPGKMDSDSVAHLVDIFGEHTSEALDSIFKVVRSGDRAEQERVYRALNEIEAGQRETRSVTEELRRGLKPQFRGMFSEPELRELNRHLNNWASRAPDRSETELFHDTKVNQFLDDYFEKPDKIRGMLEKESEKTALQQGKKVKESDDLGYDEDFENRLSENSAQLARLSDEALPAPDAHRAEWGNEGKAERLIRQAKEKRGNDPEDPVSFRWMRAAEYHSLVDDPLVAKPTDKNLGYVVAERMEGSDRLSTAGLKKFTYDTKKGNRGEDASYINAGEGVHLDAVKLAHKGNRPAEMVELKSATELQKMARTFAANVAAVIEHLGRGFDIPNDAVVAKYKDRTVTVGDLKRAYGHDKDSPAEAIPRLEAKLKDAGLSREERGRIKERIKELEFKRDASLTDSEAKDYFDLQMQRAGVVAELRAARRTGDEKAVKRLTERGEKIERQMAKMRLEDEVTSSNMRQDFDPEAQVHIAAARAPKDDDLVHKFNLDGTPVAHAPKNSPIELMSRERQRTENPAANRLRARDLDIGELGDLVDERTGERLTRRDEIVRQEREAPAPKNLPEGKATTREQKREQAARDKEGSPDPKAVAAKKAAFVERARSGDAALIKEVSTSTDAKGLQRAVEALKGEKGEGAQRTADAINKRLGELVQDDDVRYGMGTKGYSLEAADPNLTNTGRTLADVPAYIEKVLGKDIAFAWSKSLHAGDFTPSMVAPTIRVSVHALDPMGTAYHEALHAFFHQLGKNQVNEVSRVLMRAADTAAVRRQLERLLAGQPEALKQLSDPEERAAYMFQAWALGKLTVGPETKGVLTRIADFFRRVLGMWSNDERALHIMEHFQRGDFAGLGNSPDAIRAAYLEPGRNRALDFAARLTKPLTEMGEALATAGGARLRDTGIPALRELADLIKATGRDGTGDAGFIPAARIERTRTMNRLGDALRPYSKAQINAALEAMQSGSKPADVGAKVVRRVVLNELRRLRDYMVDAGVNNVGDLGEDYFPRVYDIDYLSRHQKEFVTVLERHGHANARNILNKIIAADGSEFTSERPMPGMQHLKVRALADVPDAELAPFMSKDLFSIMNSYVTQATRRAEWARRLGDEGERLGELLEQAQKQGASEADLDAARKYTMAVDGTLGDDLNPTARRLMGDMIVYQNVRLLPLAIFSSVIDPVGVVVRGGEVRDAWNTFKRGIREIPKNFKRAPGRDSMTELAETLGVIDNAALVHSLGALYSQGMVGETGRKINDTFFRYNLMEQFNTSMRVGATEAALKFIAKHADGTADRHSARWMAELGLKASDVQLDADGRPKLFEAQGLSMEQAARLRTAVNRWVDGAVLRPDAADKPLWMSDPHFMLVSHLKQFVYSFHETILKRIAHEVEHGNYRPVMAMASYVPIMIASDLVKGMIQGGGQQPEWKDDWTAGDYVWSGVQRAGLLGVGQFGADAFQHAGGLAGPTAEQLVDALKTMGGREQFGRFLLHSMPANALYAHAVSGASQPDPTFAE